MAVFGMFAYAAMFVPSAMQSLTLYALVAPSAVVRLLLAKKIHRLPVVDAQGNLIGILSRGNLVKAALAVRKATASSN
jgi:CBS-domain-containing membrane protein